MSCARCASSTLAALVGVAIIVMLAGPANAQQATWAKAAGQVRTEKRTLKTADSTTIEAVEGWLAVPERRGVATSRLIEVHYLHLKSRGKSPRAPMFYLAGGPGSTGVTVSPNGMSFWSPFLEVCDVVLVDERGTRDPDLRWRWDGPPPLEFFKSADVARAHTVEMVRRAAAEFRKRGVDLAGYQSIESADDLDAIRVAIGADKISLLGFSYGTHLGCAYLRRHDAHVESAVLVGMEGPDHTWKPPLSLDTQFRRIAAMAAADARISKQIPDLMALLERVDAKLEREPMPVKIQVDEGELTIPIGPFGLDMILRIDAGDATDIPVFPRLLWSIDQGDASLLTWFVNKRASLAVGVSGMSYATDAASGWTPGRRAMIEDQMKRSRFADVVNFPFPDIVQALDVPDLGDGFRGPLVSSARTLFLSGELDWNTPPYQAEEIKWGFTNATHIVVSNAGHEQVLLQNEEAFPVILDFLAGKDVSDRRIGYPPLRFVPLEGSDPQVRHPSVGR